MTLPRLAALLLLAAPACAPFPEVARLTPDSGTVPVLLPIDDLLAQADASVADPGPALRARADRLKARAAALSVTSPAP
jgi:hypothetical protein